MPPQIHNVSAVDGNRSRAAMGGGWQAEVKQARRKEALLFEKRSKNF
jgi:hypothetical protein